MTNNLTTSPQHPHHHSDGWMKTWSEPPAKAGERHKQALLDDVGVIETWDGYHPAGGGVWGFDSTTSIFNLGTPEQGAILKLARPIIVPVRQNFAASADFFAIGSVSALDQLNAGTTDDVKNILYMLDGLQTRDVQ